VLGFRCVKLRLRSEPPESDPSIVTRSAPFSLMKAVAPAVEVTVRAAPLGLIVSVKPEPLSSVHWLRATAPDSADRSDVTFSVTPMTAGF